MFARLASARLVSTSGALGTLLLTAGCTGFIDGGGTSSASPSSSPSVPLTGISGGNDTGGSGAVSSGPTGNGPVGSGTVDVSQCRFPSRRLVKLTPVQYDNTVRPLIGYAGYQFPSDDWKSTVGGYFGTFSNNTNRNDMTTLHVFRLFEGARKVSRAAIARSTYEYGNSFYKDPLRFKCPDTGADAACVRKFLLDFAPRLMRREVPASEVEEYVSYFTAEAAKFGADFGFEQALHALFLAPETLYRTELGDADPKNTGQYLLTAMERAQALSFFLMDAPPDAPLLDAAKSGELDTKQGIEEQTRRLLSQPPSYWEQYETGGAQGFFRFWSEYLQWSDLAHVARGWKFSWPGNPRFDTANEPMRKETQAFVHHVLWDEGASLVTLLSAPYTYLDDTLSEFYGIPIAGSVGTNPSFDKFVKTDLPQDQARLGLLTQGSFLATYAHEWENDIVRRGKYIREKLLCGKMPPPPANVNAAQPAAKIGETLRSALDAHRQAACTGCHERMDPLGFPFEPFNAVGRFRTADDTVSFTQAPDPDHPDAPFDTSGEIIGTDETDGPVKDAPELATKLAHSNDVARCVASQMYRYAQARIEAPSDACALTKIYELFTKSPDRNLIDLAVLITTSDDFFTRVAGDQ